MPFKNRNELFEDGRVLFQESDDLQQNAQLLALGIQHLLGEVNELLRQFFLVGIFAFERFDKEPDDKAKQGNERRYYADDGDV